MVPSEKFCRTFSTYFTVSHHDHINKIEEVIQGAKNTYVLFVHHYGDLHSYLRRRRGLQESEAGPLFRQIMLAVQHCHREGLVLHDLSLRNFVFKNPEKWVYIFPFSLFVLCVFYSETSKTDCKFARLSD